MRTYELCTYKVYKTAGQPKDCHTVKPVIACLCEEGPTCKEEPHCHYTGTWPFQQCKPVTIVHLSYQAIFPLQKGWYD